MRFNSLAMLIDTLQKQGVLPIKKKNQNKRREKMGYKEEEDRKWQLAKARQISRDIENSIEYFFNKDTDSKTLKRLLRELGTIVDYVAVCLFKEEE